MLLENVKKFDFMNITDFHRYGALGQGMKIAIIDTPFEIPEGWLEGKVKYAKDKLQSGSMWEHGAMTCHVIHQIAPGAEIYIFDMYSHSPWEIIGWCIRNRIDIISASIGYRNPSDYFLNRLAEASTEFAGAGGYMFASAGNSDYTGVFPPASKCAWVAVGAAELVDGHAVRKHYSAVGSELEVMGFTNLSVDIAKVGKTEWDIYTGTSAACPCVAAAMAVYMGKYGKMETREQLLEFFEENTAGVQLTARDNYRGFGLLVLPNGKPPEPPEDDYTLSWWQIILRWLKRLIGRL